MKRALMFPLLVIVAHVTAPAAATAQLRHEYSEVHMGVTVRIVLFAGSDATARAAARAAFARVRALDAMMSDYRPDSELRSLETRARSWTTVSAELFDVIARALDAARATNGAFDPTIGPLVALWRDARRTGQLPDSSALAHARLRVDWRLVQLDSARRAVRLAMPGMRLDLGGIAKGYILQAASETMRARGVARTLIEAGGDIVAGDAPPGRAGWLIEVATADTAFTRRAATLANAALATSGPDAQFVESAGVRYSHVVDPYTGTGLTHARVTHVIAAHGATADALATAASLLGCAAPHIRARLAMPDDGGMCTERP